MLVALMFLTRVPVGMCPRRDDVARATLWFPLVGAGIGLCAAAIARGLAELPALPPMLGALLLVGLGAWITGAIHLDGLADTADGFGGGRTADAVLRIMHDPRVGSFGVLALVLAVGIKVVAIATLIDRRMAPAFLIAAPALARWTVIPLALWLPYARAEGGLGQSVAGTQTPGRAAIATVLAIGVAVIALGQRAVVVTGVAALVTLAVGRNARRRIGGVTGDVFGACVELTETSLLVTGVLMS
jgi:cobalamin 5'-phosphate synthase/cobalamin synthase